MVSNFPGHWTTWSDLTIRQSSCCLHSVLPVGWLGDLVSKHSKCLHLNTQWMEKYFIKLGTPVELEDFVSLAFVIRQKLQRLSIGVSQEWSFQFIDACQQKILSKQAYQHRQGQAQSVPSKLINIDRAKHNQSLIHSGRGARFAFPSLPYPCPHHCWTAPSAGGQPAAAASSSTASSSMTRSPGMRLRTMTMRIRVTRGAAGNHKWPGNRFWTQNKLFLTIFADCAYCVDAS